MQEAGACSFTSTESRGQHPLDVSSSCLGYGHVLKEDNEGPMLAGNVCASRWGTALIMRSPLLGRFASLCVEKQAHNYELRLAGERNESKMEDGWSSRSLCCLANCVGVCPEFARHHSHELEDIRAYVLAGGQKACYRLEQGCGYCQFLDNIHVGHCRVLWQRGL